MPWQVIESFYNVLTLYDLIKKSKGESMGEVKEIAVKNRVISRLFGKKRDNNFIPEIIKRVKSNFNKSLRTLPVYDQDRQGPLVEFIVPNGIKEIERYWLQEPYTFVSILEDRKKRYYKLLEPALTMYEKELLERINEDLQDILVLNSTTSKLEKKELLIDRTLFLLEQYKADVSASAIEKILYYLQRNLLSYDKINPLLCDPYIEDISCDGVEIPV